MHISYKQVTTQCMSVFCDNIKMQIISCTYLFKTNMDIRSGKTGVTNQIISKPQLNQNVSSKNLSLCLIPIMLFLWICNNVPFLFPAIFPTPIITKSCIKDLQHN